MMTAKKAATKTTKKPKAVPKKPRASNAKTDDKKLSALAAAARVLSASDEAMTTMELIDAMAAKNYWTSPGGKTPERTLYSALVRDITAHGKESRFKKGERGKFLANK